MTTTRVNERGRPSRPPLGLVVPCAALAVGFALPAAYVVWRNFTVGSDPLAVLFSDRTAGPLMRTIQLTVLVTVTAAAIGTLMAWLTVRTDLPGRRIFSVLLPLPLVYPSFVGAAAVRQTFNPGGLLNGWLETVGLDGHVEMRGFFGAWFVLSAFTYPYVYLPVAARLMALPPTLEESARVLGSEPRRAFWGIVRPQISSAVGAGALLVALYTISDFGAVEVMRYETLTRALFINRQSNQPVAFAVALILLSLGLLIVICERLVSRRTPRLAAPGSRRPLHVPLGRHRWPAFAVATAVVGLALLGPGMALIDWAVGGLMRDDRPPLRIDAGEVLGATWNTAWLSTLTAVLTVLVVLPIAYLTTRHRSAGTNVLNAVVVATFALPGLLIALAFVGWSDFLPGGFALLIGAYVVHFGATAMRASQVAVAATPRSLDDAARMLGASRWRRLRTVEIPLMLPGLAAGAGLVLLSTMKELPATLLLAPIEFSTLVTEIWPRLGEAFVTEAGVLSLILVALSAVLTWLLVIRQAAHT